MIQFQNYHRHSQYTNPLIADSIVSNRDYAQRAVELGHGLISVMEHGWSGRYIEGWELAHEYGLKFIQGAELYWVKNRFEKDNSNCHIYVGAMNENGRRALNDIASEAFISGFYGRGRVDIDLLLSLPSDDVIVTSACIAGWKYEDADEIMLRFADHFRNNFYLEVQYHNTDAQAQLNERILNLHYKEGIPIIMGCDSHYIKENGGDDRSEFIRSKKIEYPEEEGWYLDYPDGDTAYQRFAQQCVLSHDEIMEAINNTNCFLKVEEYDCDCFRKGIKMPSIYPTLTQEEKDNLYDKTIWDAWKKEKQTIEPDLWGKYEDEIAKELDVVRQTKHSDYFLFNHEMIKEGRRLGGVLTHSGRGSAVSFYTNKLAGFTDVDRIAAKVHMYPERFMSPTRILQTQSLADIDFNVADPEPFAQAQINILGENHSYPMIAYGTMKASAAWKMYARAKEVDFDLANSVSDQIRRYEKALKHADEDDKDLINAFDYINEEFHDIYQKSTEYQGVVTDYSPHPCAYLIYTGDIRREIGLIKIKDCLCCCMDGKWAEEYKFLKNDLLTVSVVKLIDLAFQYAGVDMISSSELLEACPPDSGVWDIYKRGCVLGINQVEKKGTAHRVKTYAPTNISELCSFVAAIRPGFKSMYKLFESRKKFDYGIDSLDSIIQTEEMPNSFILYQEMSMAVLNYAGIPMSECYDIIKNIAKKRVEKVLKYKEQFLSGFQTILIQNEGKSQTEAEELAAKIWQILEDSSSYSFNASHSYCVSIDSLYGAYLKYHYPLAFYKAYLEIQEMKGDKDKMNKAKDEAERYFQIKFPPYKYGQDNRQITINADENSISNYLTAIKGFGQKIADAAYHSTLIDTKYLIEILAVFDSYGIKSTTTLQLAKIDYFTDFGTVPQVCAMIEFFDMMKQGCRKMIKKNECSIYIEQMIKKYASDRTKSGKEAKTWTITDIWGLLHAYEDMIRRMPIEDIDYRTKIQNQKDILGYVNFKTNKKSDLKKLLILEEYPLKDKSSGEAWGHAVITQSIGSGKKNRLTIPSFRFDRDPLQQFDVIELIAWHRNKSGYLYLDDYELIA